MCQTLKWLTRSDCFDISIATRRRIFRIIFTTHPNSGNSYILVLYLIITEIIFSTTDRADLIATIIYISGLLVQFAYYSFPVEEIVFEVSSFLKLPHLDLEYNEHQ